MVYNPFAKANKLGNLIPQPKIRGTRLVFLLDSKLHVCVTNHVRSYVGVGVAKGGGAFTTGISKLVDDLLASLVSAVEAEDDDDDDDDDGTGDEEAGDISVFKKNDDDTGDDEAGDDDGSQGSKGSKGSQGSQGSQGF